MRGPFRGAVSLGLCAALFLGSGAAHGGAGGRLLAYGYAQPYSPAFTQAPVVHQTTVVQQAPPETLQMGGRYYDASIGGLRDYVDTLAASDPELWKTLDPELSSLENRRVGATASFVAGGVGGGVMMSLAFVNADEHGFNKGLLYGGAGVLVAGLLLGLALHPGRDDILDFVNLHNSQPGASPIVWQGHVAQPVDRDEPESPRTMEGRPARHASDAVNPLVERVSLSPPPADAAGFTLGSTLDEARAACEGAQATATELSESEVDCSGTAADIGEKAETTLSFCEGKLCVIELTMHPESNWTGEIAGLIDALGKKYGQPNREPSPVTSECREDMDACFADGRAHVKAFWKFPSRERIELEAGKSGDDDSAVRLRYEKRPEPKAKGRKNRTKKKGFKAL